MTALKEKCKNYQATRDYKLDTDKYIIVHVDGRSFSKAIKNKFEKPFDKDFIKMMDETAKYLCEKVQGCQLAYVQSDEITLVLKKLRPESDIFFGGRMCKMQSIIASMATGKFNQLITLYNIKSNAYDYAKIDYLDTLYNAKDIVRMIKDSSLYEFDCKVWDVNDGNDAFAWLLFRNIDCVRNSKSQTAQTYIPHKDLLGKTADEAVEMLKEKNGIDWNALPDEMKYGRIIRKEDIEMGGADVVFVRKKWVVTTGIDLTNSENRIKFIENNNFLKTIEKNEEFV